MELIDLSVADKFNAIGGTIVVVATYIFGEHWVLFAAFLALNILDYITGVIKSKIKNMESSSAGLKGILKKFSYWICIVIGFGLVPILNELGSIMGADLSAFSPVFGWYLLAVFAINEVRSVLENLVECGVAVPQVLIKGMAVTQKVIDATQDKVVSVIDGSLNIDKNAEEKYKVDITTAPDELEKKDVVTLRIRTIDEEDQ